MIGSLLYLAVCTRPNISFSVAVLARQVHTPISRNLALVKRIMRYVAGTSDFGLLYPRSCPVVPQSLHASADADWGGCKETRKSNSGWVIAIYGTTIVWRTRKQSIIANSSAESEYMALFDCAKDVCWMRKLFWEMSVKEPWPEKGMYFEPTTVQIDSSSANSLALNKQVSSRNKPINLKYHFV